MFLQIIIDSTGTGIRMKCFAYKHIIASILKYVYDQCSHR